jgi:hypothetical protein
MDHRGWVRSFSLTGLFGMLNSGRGGSFQTKRSPASLVFVCTLAVYIPACAHRDVDRNASLGRSNPGVDVYGNETIARSQAQLGSKRTNLRLNILPEAHGTHIHRF